MSKTRLSPGSSPVAGQADGQHKPVEMRGKVTMCVGGKHRRAARAPSWAFREGFLEEEHLSQARMTLCHFPSGIWSGGTCTTQRHGPARLPWRSESAWGRVREVGFRHEWTSGHEPLVSMPGTGGGGQGREIMGRSGEMQAVCVSKTTVMLQQRVEAWALHPALRSQHLAPWSPSWRSGVL